MLSAYPLEGKTIFRKSCQSCQWRRELRDVVLVSFGYRNRRLRIVGERTQVEEEGCGDNLLDGEGGLGLHGADLLLGLLRGGDCRLVVSLSGISNALVLGGLGSF